MYYPVLSFEYINNEYVPVSILIRDGYMNNDVVEIPVKNESISIEEAFEMFLVWMNILTDQYHDGYDDGYTDGLNDNDTDDE